MRPAVQGPPPEREALQLVPLFVQQAQQNLRRGDDPVAEVEQGQRGRGDGFRRQSCTEDFGRAGYESQFEAITLTAKTDA